MKSDVQGCSTCPKGKEQYEIYKSAFDGKLRVQYDFRTEDDRLFSCIAKSLEDARKQRDLWLVNELDRMAAL